MAISAKEKRDVATMDIPGTFLQANLGDERVHIKFEGRMAELLAMIEPQLYRQYVVVEKGKPVLYAELKQALYGMLQASLKFWEQILEDLIGLGFEVNPYDWCVANQVNGGKQETIGWHVDDFIITHADPDVNTELIEWFQQKYGDMTSLTVQRGVMHDYCRFLFQIFEFYCPSLPPSLTSHFTVGSPPRGGPSFQTFESYWLCCLIAVLNSCIVLKMLLIPRSDTYI